VRWFWPEGLAGRVAVVLALALVGVQLLTLPFFLKEQASAASALYQSSTVDRIAHVIRLFEPMSAEQRRQLLPAVNSPSLSLDLFFQLRADEKSAQEAPELARSLAAVLHRDVIIKRVDPVETAAYELFPTQQRIAIWVPLSDQSWLRFSTSSALRSQGWVLHVSAQLLLICIILVLFAMLAARQITRPIRTFASAAERLGTDVNAPPIEERGSRELRSATRAFNTMQLRLQRYVEDRTRMLAAISHDLRTSLTRLRLRTEFIADEQQRHKAELDLQQMEEMLGATLSFARDDADQEPPVNLDIAKLLHTLCDDMNDMGKEVEYLGPEALSCCARPIALQRAIGNVLMNAADYGGSTKLHLESTEHSISIKITDQGPGIPEDQMEAVFEPFVRLDKARNRSLGGSGLGLAIARSVMRSHGGDIRLSNLPAGGLCVLMTLPG
jgi:signal transduction histidine kinase